MSTFPESLLGFIYGETPKRTDYNQFADTRLVEADVVALGMSNGVEEKPVAAAAGAAFLVLTLIILSVSFFAILLVICCSKCYEFWSFVREIRKPGYVKESPIKQV